MARKSATITPTYGSDDLNDIEIERYDEPDYEALAAAMAQDAAEEPDDEELDDVDDAVTEAIIDPVRTIVAPEIWNGDGWEPGEAMPDPDSYGDGAEQPAPDYAVVTVNPDGFVMPDSYIFINKDNKAVDFAYDAHMDAVVRGVIQDYNEKFGKLEDLDIQCWWRKKGRITAGKKELASCVKPSGMIAQLTRADVILYLAYDHIAGADLTNEQMEKLIAHELCHVSVGNKGKVTIVDHDFEGFIWEYQTFGPWRAELASVTKVANAEQFEIPEFQSLLGVTA